MSVATASPPGIAIDAVRAAQRVWKAVSVRQRLGVVGRFRELLAENPAAICVPMHRPPAETLAAEVLPLLDACRFLERDAGRLLVPRRVGSWRRPLWLWGVRSEVRREPFGVVLIVGPGNYPLLLPGVQALQALTAGNAVLLKPAPGGRAVADAFSELVARAGLPAGLLTVLPETVDSVAEALAAGVDKVVLTGSAGVGRQVLSQLADHLIPATMELSGCDAMFVLPDADLELVSKALAFGLRWNGSATCIAPRRVFVVADRASDLERCLVQRLAATAPAADHSAAARRAGALIREALTEGARLAAGSVLADGITPCVVADARPTMRLLQEEVFAPVVTLAAVADASAALQLAQASPYGLGATVFGHPAAAWRLAADVQAGSVVVNDVIVPTVDPRLPFGGRGASGFGVTRGAEGLLEMTTVKVISERRGRLRAHLEPPPPDAAELFASYIRAVHGRSPGRLRAAWTLLRELMRQGKRGQQ